MLFGLSGGKSLALRQKKAKNYLPDGDLISFRAIKRGMNLCQEKGLPATTSGWSPRRWRLRWSRWKRFRKSIGPARIWTISASCWLRGVSRDPSICIWPRRNADCRQEPTRWRSTRLTASKTGRVERRSDAYGVGRSSWLGGLAELAADRRGQHLFRGKGQPRAFYQADPAQGQQGDCIAK